MKIYLILLSCLFSATHTNAQKDQDAVFRKSKGTWNYPMDSVSKIYTSQERKLIPDAHYYSKAITFFSENSRPVRAVHPGIVVLIKKIDDVYLVLTKFGNYFIAYSGIVHPMIKKDDRLRENDLIGICGKIIDDEYGLELFLSKGSEDLDAAEWFFKSKL